MCGYDGRARGQNPQQSRHRRHGKPARKPWLAEQPPIAGENALIGRTRFETNLLSAATLVAGDKLGVGKNHPPADEPEDPGGDRERPPPEAFSPLGPPFLWRDEGEGKDELLTREELRR